MQYNFPMLPGQPGQWRERLRVAVDALGDDNFDELRPTYRSDLTALSHAGARWMGTPPERTFLTASGHHGSLIALMASGLAGQTIAVDAAAYSGALVQARAMGCPVVGCAMDEEGMLPESLRERCAGDRIAAIYVTPTVHNPLGFVASLARREALVAVAREFDLLILEDDAYGYMEPEAPPTLAKLAPERTFYVRGLSKSYAPAARTGFLVVPERFVPGMLSAIMNSAAGSSLVHNRAAVSLIEDGTLDRLIAEKNVEGARRNAAARSLLGDRCWPGARAAWHLWVNLPAQTTPQWFEQRMAEREVAISGGNWFAASQDAPNGFRIALGGEVDSARALEGVARVVEELDRL